MKLLQLIVIGLLLVVGLNTATAKEPVNIEHCETFVTDSYYFPKHLLLESTGENFTTSYLHYRTNHPSATLHGYVDDMRCRTGFRSVRSELSGSGSWDGYERIRFYLVLFDVDDAEDFFRLWLFDGNSIVHSEEGMMGEGEIEIILSSEDSG